MKTLEGRRALVTGGGRGIGAATAEALARAGAAVAVAARSLDQVDEVAAGLRGKGHDAYAFRCDVSDPAEIRDLMRSARDAMGQVDVLVNNAGIAPSNPLRRVTLEEWSRVMSVNVTGTFLCTQALLEEMVARGWGRVVNVASIAGLRGGRYMAAYTASKHAQVGFTRAAAAEVAGTGVTVSAVCPGFVDTPLTDASVANIMRHTGRSASEALELLLAQTDQTRLIEASEVADAVVSLCLDEAADQNGRIVVLDGKDPSPEENEEP